MVINWVLPNLKKWRNYDDLRLHIHIIVCTHSKWRNWESSSGESAFRNWFINTTALHGGRIFLYLKELARVLIPCRGMNVEQEWGKREKKKKPNREQPWKRGILIGGSTMSNMTEAEGENWGEVIRFENKKVSDDSHTPNGWGLGPGYKRNNMGK